MKPYYKTLAIILPFCLLVASTCKKEDTPGLKSVQLDNPFEISVSEQAVIQGSNTVMEVTDISDSRCPADVQCFWAGNTKVKLNVRGLGVNDILLNFCIGQCDNRYRKADTLAIQYENRSYSIIMSEVNPYPGTGSEKKTAVFIIRKD